MTQEVLSFCEGLYLDPARLLASLKQRKHIPRQDILNAVNGHASTKIVDIIQLPVSPRAKTILVANFLENQEHVMSRSSGHLPQANRGERVYAIENELSKATAAETARQDFELHVAAISMFGEMACQDLGIKPAGHLAAETAEQTS